MKRKIGKKENTGTIYSNAKIQTRIQTSNKTNKRTLAAKNYTIFIVPNSCLKAKPLNNEVLGTIRKRLN